MSSGSGIVVFSVSDCAGRQSVMFERSGLCSVVSSFGVSERMLTM